RQRNRFHLHVNYFVSNQLLKPIVASRLRLSFSLSLTRKDPTMKRFSQRIGAAEVPTVIQLEGISDALRNSIWNYIHTLFDEGDSGWWRIAENSAQFFFKVPVDELPHYNHPEWNGSSSASMAWHGTKFMTSPSS
ncbi:MAG TPA: hypothetical protein PK528_11805, partial [Syntrophorhabdus sp.]|nr:hypothetical protein [Syntrophorhabdus sp.]